MNENENQNGIPETPVKTQPEASTVNTENVTKEPVVVVPSVETESTPEIPTAQTIPEVVTPGPAADQVQTNTTTDSTPVASKWGYYVGAVVVVIIIFGGILFAMEQQGRINTGLFTPFTAMRDTRTTVATVNGESINQYSLTVSMNQIEAGAVASGVDVADPSVQVEIQNQAIEMLVNTELLNQEAAARNITVSDQAVQDRLDVLQTEVGGPEVLAERMREFAINEETLLRDIRNELTIQALLEVVFNQQGITISEEEALTLYNQAAEVQADLPPFAEVQPQIEAQIRADKEQEIVTGLLDELNANANIEILL